jgi:ATP-dependent RNA helicase DBP3
MGKSDDSIARRKNKSIRRKQNDSAKVSTRVAAIIAAKKRRKTGKRSMCQGMCYSLPTLDDPFNDRNGNPEPNETKKSHPSKTDRKNKFAGKNVIEEDNRAPKRARVQKGETEDKTRNPKKARIDKIRDTKGRSFETQSCPTKFLIQCLKSIQSALQHEGILSSEAAEKPLFMDEWGVQFWKCRSVGKDVLQENGACSTVEQIAWIAATAGDEIAAKEGQGLSLPNPFLLFLVPSLEKARMVRSVCKPLKALGIHTVSLHPGSSLDHQIQGLKNCEPEFLVSTPERLLELVSLKAIDISKISLLVVDGLESMDKGGGVEVIKSVRKLMTEDPHTVVFNDCSSNKSISEVLNLLPGSYCKLSPKSKI